MERNVRQSHEWYLIYCIYGDFYYFPSLLINIKKSPNNNIEINDRGDNKRDKI